MVKETTITRKLKKGYGVDYCKLIKLAKSLGIDRNDYINNYDCTIDVAFAEGYNVGKSEKKAEIAHKKEQRKKILLADADREEGCYLNLTNDQLRLLKWLYENNYLDINITYTEAVEFNEYTI